MKRWTRDEMAARIARDIPEGAYVNLGIGLPTLVANAIPAEREVILHTENGLLGMGPAPAPGQEDPDLINAGKQPVTALSGASFFHQADSFGMMRGGHLDICVLGAFQVSEGQKGEAKVEHVSSVAVPLLAFVMPPIAIPAVGGAMDLAIGAKRTWVMMEHVTREGAPKLVVTCRYPLTGKTCVERVYTDLAVIDVTPRGLEVVEIAPGATFQDVAALTEAPLADARKS